MQVDPKYYAHLTGQLLLIIDTNGQLFQVAAILCYILLSLNLCYRYMVNGRARTASPAIMLSKHSIKKPNASQ